MRVLIVDDDDVFASLVETLVCQDERIELVGRAHDGREAVRLAQELAPDVVVMDIEMPVMNGIDATRHLSQTNPATRVVIFTGSDEQRDEERARAAGAVAFVRKAHIDALLLDAIRRAARPSGSDAAQRSQRLEVAVALP